jgi:two-component system response regulator DesR
MLVRRALAEVLARQDDLSVVAELGACNEVLSTVAREQPQVAVLDYSLPGEPGIHKICIDLSETMPNCRVLLILDRSVPTFPAIALARMAPRIGLLAIDVSPSQLIESVRKLVRGEAVLDVEIAVAALNAAANTPLTCREQEVLLLATDGAPPKEIAARLFLTDGTVRNYLSRITSKIGARTLIEAIRRAQDAGWV